MNIQIPTTPLNLDTSTHIHATDENGVKIIDPDGLEQEAEMEF